MHNQTSTWRRALVLHSAGCCLPKETEDDDGDGERDERHAVTDGVAHFDGAVELFLGGGGKERRTLLHAVKAAYLNLVATVAAAHGPCGGFIIVGADHVIITGVVQIVPTVHYVRLHADIGPAVLGAGLGQVAC